MYGKATETAIAAMSRLAEVWDGGSTRLSAADIAESRGLQRPFVAKVLTTLSQAGLVSGSRGPGGGFTLTRAPREVSIYEVFVLFEREDDSDVCPFGGGICGVGPECPLHEKLVNVQRAVGEVLHHTTFEVFSVTDKKRKKKAKSTSSARSRAKRRPRESFRASKSTRQS